MIDQVGAGDPAAPGARGYGSPMSEHGSRSGFIGRVAATVVVASLLASAAPAGADTPPFTAVGGGAYGVKVYVAGVPLVPPVTLGPLPEVTVPPDGGSDDDAVYDGLVPFLIGSVVLRVATSGSLANGVFSSVRVSDLIVSTTGVGPIPKPAPPLIGVLGATSRCAATASGASGASTVAGLVVAGVPVGPLGTGPNVTIEVPGVGRAILNEQVTTGVTGGVPAAITVNAVRLVLDGPLGAGEVVVAQSRCAVS